MKHRGENYYTSYKFTDVDGVKFIAYFRGAWRSRAIKAFRKGPETFYKKYGKKITIRKFLGFHGIVSRIKYLEETK